MWNMIMERFHCRRKYKCNNFVIKFDKTGKFMVTYAVECGRELSVLFFLGNKTAIDGGTECEQE